MKGYYKLILWFWWGWSSIAKVTKIASLQCLYNTSKKKVDEVFFHTNKYQSFLQLISALSASKFPTRWYCHSSWPWSSISKYSRYQVCNVFTISQKKKLGMEFVFCIQINIKVSTSWQYSFLWKWPDMSKVPSILRKKCRNSLCVLLWCKTFRYCSLLLVLLLETDIPLVHRCQEYPKKVSKDSYFH